jgi:glycosyltransferase involved in cell wall biosynthesis
LGESPSRADASFRAVRQELAVAIPTLAAGSALAGRSFGIVSTYPPTPCGLATFAAALSAGLIANGATVDVVRCGASPAVEDALVLATIEAEDCSDLPAAHDVLNATDIVIVQHEFGIFGGADGCDVLDVLAGIRVPTIVVAHTVPRQATPNQQRVLQAVCDAASSVVVMTEAARTRLIADFEIAPEKVEVIAHGAATPAVTDGEARAARHRPRVLTWGLLGPGKGIEWAIDALAELRDIEPRVEYVIAGATHPKVRAVSGEAYREMLVQRAWAAGVAPSVTFDDQYRDLASLTELISSADVVVLPYDSEDQVTSGVLVDAVAAGRPVISTAFPHAVELLGTGAGIVVPQRDAAALASAMRVALTQPVLADAMAAEARRLAPALSWHAVAAQYGAVGARLVACTTAVSA